MRIPWTRLALVAAVSLSAASATAVTNFDPTNHATRLIGLLGEDSGCTNTVTPGVPPHVADPGCFVHASDVGPPAATYTDPSNDYYDTITWLGPGVNALTGGTNTFQVTVPSANWGKIIAVLFTASGATLTGTTSLSFVFDVDNQKVAAANTCGDPGSPGPNPCFYQATATFAGNGIFLTGLPDNADYPYYGNSSTLGGTQFSGPPLTFSCAWSAGLVTPVPLVGPPSALGPAGYLSTPIPIPSPPCGVPVAQQGFEHGGSLPNTSIDFYQISTIELAATPGTAYADAVFSDYKFWLAELTDTDGDGIPDAPTVPLGTVTKTLFDNCPFTPNAAQTDTGGIGTGSAPDGIGDACQCGDADNNGIVNNTDATFIKRAVAGLPPNPGGVTTLAGYHKCQVVLGSPPGDTCNATQANLISRAVASLAPGVKQGCHAATVFP